MISDNLNVLVHKNRIIGIFAKPIGLRAIRLFYSNRVRNTFGVCLFRKFSDGRFQLARIFTKLLKLKKVILYES